MSLRKAHPCSCENLHQNPWSSEKIFTVARLFTGPLNSCYLPPSNQGMVLFLTPWKMEASNLAPFKKGPNVYNINPMDFLEFSWNHLAEFFFAYINGQSSPVTPGRSNRLRRISETADFWSCEWNSQNSGPGNLVFFR